MLVRAIYNMPELRHTFVVIKSENDLPTIFHKIARERFQDVYSLKSQIDRQWFISKNWSQDYIEEDDLMDILKPVGVSKRHSVDFLGINAIHGCPKDNDPTYMPKCVCYVPEQDIIEVYV